METTVEDLVGPVSSLGQTESGDSSGRPHELDRATELFQQVMESAKKPHLRAKAAFALGNAKRKLKKYDEASQAYRRALLENPRLDGARRNLEIAAITRHLKQLAKALEIPIIALSQLSRQPERRGGDHRPQLSDLRESGSIEQDADIVAFIYREELYKPDDPSLHGMAEFLLAKNRHGETRNVPLAFIGKTTTFKSRAYQQEEPPF